MKIAIDDLICKVENLLGDWIRLPKVYPEWLSSAIAEGLRSSLHQMRRNDFECTRQGRP